MSKNGTLQIGKLYKITMILPGLMTTPDINRNIKKAFLKKRNLNTFKKEYLLEKGKERVVKVIIDLLERKIIYSFIHPMVTTKKRLRRVDFNNLIKNYKKDVEI